MSSLKAAISRDIVTPVTTVLFAIVTVTGLMLLLHLQPGLVRFSHEWLGVAFVAIAAWHLARNGRALSFYFRRRLPLAAAAAGLVASLLFIGMTADGGQRGPGALFAALSQARLETVAPALGLTVEQATARLAASGVPAAPQRTLGAIAREAGRDAPEVLGLLLAGPG